MKCIWTEWLIWYFCCLIIYSIANPIFHCVRTRCTNRLYQKGNSARSNFLHIIVIWIWWSTLNAFSACKLFESLANSISTNTCTFNVMKVNLKKQFGRTKFITLFQLQRMSIFQTKRSFHRTILTDILVHFNQRNQTYKLLINKRNR